MSSRLPPVAVIHLLISTNSHRLVISKSALADLVKGIQEELQSQHPGYEVEMVDFPTLKDLYPSLGGGDATDENESDAYTPNGASPTEVGKLEGGVYLHSSGSTGLPKPIRLTNKVISSYARMRE
jgi:acyl-coenzyme A synthetase/AMP-(fatty) acid ligase